jgi:hypothetical protein
MFVMTEKARIKIAALVTALSFGAAVSAATLAHPHPVSVKTVRAGQIAIPAQPGSGANPFPTTEHESYD